MRPLDHILGLDPVRDSAEIVSLDYRYQFPRDLVRAAGFALFRTTAIPGISEVLEYTAAFAHGGYNRTAGTALLIRELALSGYESKQGVEAIRRINQAHRPFDIPNQDKLYVLSALTYEPIRWIDRVGWRRLAEPEKLAAFYFWREVGRRMDIQDLPADTRAFEQFNRSYERQHLRYADSNQRVAGSARDHIVSSVAPRPFRALGGLALYAVMDEPLLEAAGFPCPPLTLRYLAARALRLRARVVRLRHWATERTRP
jgi:hypothetical protein